MAGICKSKAKKAIITYVMIMLASSVLNGWIESDDGVGAEGKLSYVLTEAISHKLDENYFMLSAFLKDGSEYITFETGFISTIQEAMPICAYVDAEHRKKEAAEPEVVREEEQRMEELYIQKEGSDEDNKKIAQEQLDYGEDALHIENSMLAEMEQENNRFKEEMELARIPQGNGASTAMGIAEFNVPIYPAYTYDWAEAWEYDNLVSNFFAIDASTDLKKEYVSLDKLLYRDMWIEKEQEGPQILIYHTHSQEAFADSVKGDASTTIVGAGEKLSRLLTEKYGFSVIHHKGEYDVETRDDAYSNSLPEIEKLLEENPSIQVVIDLHRDEMPEGKKLVMDLQGRPTARFMFFNGMSHIRDKGDISYLENPYIQDNLAFSFQAQVAANEYYPGIARKIYLKAYRYNMHLRAKSMLIELGAQNNTVEEIMNACDPLAHILAIVLNKEL